MKHTVTSGYYEYTRSGEGGLREAILALLDDCGPMYPEDIAKRLGASHWEVSDLTAEMAREGVLGTPKGE